MEIEIGRGKKARRAYGFDDIAIVPSRRTRDPDDVDITWQLGDYRLERPPPRPGPRPVRPAAGPLPWNLAASPFALPLMASAMDGVVSPATAGIIGKLGG